MQNNHQHTQANRDKWSRRASGFDQKRFDFFRWMQNEVLSITDIQASCRFLDLGCGTGWAVRQAHKLVNGNGFFYGLDVSPRMISIAKDNALEFPNCQFIIASSNQIPFESNFFDTIICTNSFHHYFSPNETMQEIQRVLRPGGKIYILDVTTDDPFIQSVDTIVRTIEKEHIHFYSSTEYGQMFISNNLSPVNNRPFTWIYPIKIHIAQNRG